MRRSISTVSFHWPAAGPWAIRAIFSRRPTTLKPWARCSLRLGFVLRKDARLDRPDAPAFRRVDQRLEQECPYPPTAGCLGNVDGVFHDTGVRRAPGNGGDRRPAEDPAGERLRHDPVGGEAGFVETAPIRCLNLERGLTGRDSLNVDPPDLGPIGFPQRPDNDVRRRTLIHRDASRPAVCSNAPGTRE